MGFEAGPDQGLALYQAIVDHPEGVLVGVQDIGKISGDWPQRTAGSGFMQQR